MPQPVIIDAHMHLYYTVEEGLKRKGNYQVWEYGQKPDVSFSKFAGATNELLGAIDGVGVSKGVILNIFPISYERNRAVANLSKNLDKTQKKEAVRAIESGMGDLLKASNVRLCTTAGEYRKLIPFITVDPSLLGIEETQEHIHEMVKKHGAGGVKLHQVIQRFYMHDERMLPVLHTCVELDLPFIVHTGPSHEGAQYADPRAYIKVSKAFPDLRLILAHMGGGAWRQTRDVARTCPNICFDCSEIIEWIGAPKAPTEKELANLILDVGADRVMMGSDFPWYDIDHTVKRIMELPLISKEQKEAILGANAIRILKL